MFKLTATDLLGNVLDKQHFMCYPDAKQIDTFFFTVMRRYETLIEVNVTQLKYIEMGL